MKKFVTLFLTAALMACMCLPAAANDGTVKMYTTTQVTAYKYPYAGSEVAGTLSANKDVTTFPDQAQNGFAKCFTNETGHCYIPQAFLSTSGSSPSPSPSSNQRVVTGTTNYLGLRSRPADGDQYVIGQLHNGDYFYITSYYDNTYVYGYTSSGKEGYVKSAYLTTPGSGTTGTTWYDGHDWSPVYNYEYYYNKYPDVAAAYGPNPSAVLEHFVKHGIYEARQGRSDWNVYDYMNQHWDLYNRFGNNYAAYYNYAVGIIK